MSLLIASSGMFILDICTERIRERQSLRWWQPKYLKCHVLTCMTTKSSGVGPNLRCMFSKHTQTYYNVGKCDLVPIKRKLQTQHVIESKACTLYFELDSLDIN